MADGQTGGNGGSEYLRQGQHPLRTQEAPCRLGYGYALQSSPRAVVTFPSSAWVGLGQCFCTGYNAEPLSTILIKISNQNLKLLKPNNTSRSPARLISLWVVRYTECNSTSKSEEVQASEGVSARASNNFVSYGELHFYVSAVILCVRSDSMSAQHTSCWAPHTSFWAPRCSNNHDGLQVFVFPNIS